MRIKKWLFSLISVLFLAVIMTGCEHGHDHGNEHSHDSEKQNTEQMNTSKTHDSID